MLDYKVDANRNACQSSAMYDACQHVCTNKVFEVTVMKHRRDQSEMLAEEVNANVLFLLLLLHLPSCSICLVKHYWSDLSRPLVENLTGCIEHYAV